MQIKNAAKLVILAQSGQLAANIKLTITGEIPKQLSGKPFQVQVEKQFPNGEVQLRTKSGQTLKATVEPPLPQGTKLLINLPVNLKGGNLEAKVLELLHLPPTEKGKAAPQAQGTAKGVAPQTPSLLSVLTAKETPSSAVVKNLAVVPSTPEGKPLPLPQGQAILRAQTPPSTTAPQTFEATFPPKGEGRTSQPLPTLLQGKPSIPLEVGQAVRVNITAKGEAQVLQVLEKPQPPVKEIPNTPSSPQRQAAQVILEGKITLPVKASGTKTAELPAELPKNITLQARVGEVLSKPAKPSSPLQNVTQEVHFPKQAGLKKPLTLNLQAPHALAKGTEMTIRFTSDGLTEVLRVVGTDHLGGHHRPVGGVDNEAPEGRAQQQHAASSKEGAPLPIKQGMPKPFAPNSIHVGTVQAQGEKGMHVLSFADGQQLKVQAMRTLPLGAQLTLHITPAGEAEILNITLPEATGRTQALTNLSLNWQGFKEALGLLKRENPLLHERTIQQIPNVKNFLPALLHFTQSVAQDNIEKALSSETMNILRALGVDLSADFHNLHQAFRNAETPDGWRALLFPYITAEDDTPHQGSFFWRNDEKEKSKGHTRFVLNVSFSELGPIQLDGLMHKGKLTLKLRIRQTATPAFEEGLQKIITQTFEKLSINGSISVETKEYLEIDPLHDMLSNANTLNVTA